MKSYMAKPDSVEQKWYVVDASGKTLGRLATQLAHRLRGKHKPEFTPYVDTGDFYVVINAEKITVTGNKAKDKIYYHHSGYQGGLREESFEKLIQRKPEQAIEHAVKGMLPKGPLGRKMILKMKVYAGNQHPHEAQQPASIDL